ncbi:MAG: exopolysaccharide biosynthesis polyprenyl glycosylphosphotransferase [Bacteroidetes bacterium]|nr:exopolysaccharide biosynthesis polyprenyl glycosylphosphotransferase [Bacteroidota bacterium]
MPSLVRVIFLIGDILLLNLSVTFAFAVAGTDGADLTNRIYLIIYSNITWLFLVVVASPYTFSKVWDRPGTLKNQLIFICIHLLVVASLVFLYGKNYSLFLIALIYFFFVPIFYTWKLVVLFLARWTEIQKRDVKNVLLVCEPEVAREARQHLFAQSDWKYNFLGVVNMDQGKVPMPQVQLFCSENEVDEILVCQKVRTDLQELINFGLDRLVPIKLMADTRNGDSADVKHFNQTPFVKVAALPLDDQMNQFFKRAIDLVSAILFILLIMSWLLPVMAIIIKFDSRGPVFFKQKRNGKGNRPFLCIKFRTMVVNKEADTKQATANDSRITKVGKFLRKSSIDELPQIFNVFLGDMSLIGPRPHPIKLNEQFAPRIKKLTSRHYVKPGITGLAQAMGYRGETSTLSDMKNRITLDRFYIENWSFALDVKIVYLTIVSLIRGSEKAY